MGYGPRFCEGDVLGEGPGCREGIERERVRGFVRGCTGRREVTRTPHDLRL